MSQVTLLPVQESPSIILHNGKPATTSLEVAKYFDKRHDNVFRDINKLQANCPISFNALNFEESDYVDSRGKKQLMHIISKDGFMLLVMGYNGKKAINIKLAYIAAFNLMDEHIHSKPALPEASALPALPEAPPVPDFNDQYRIVREDLELIRGILNHLIFSVQTCCAQPVQFSKRELLERMVRSARSSAASLRTAEKYLTEMNRFALLLK